MQLDSNPLGVLKQFMRLSQRELVERLQQPTALQDLCVFNDVKYIVVENDSSDTHATPLPPCPLIGVGHGSQANPLFDTRVETEEELEPIIESIERHPIASALFVQLLRLNEKVSISDALVAESLVFSTLQHGSEFLSWLANRSQDSQHEEQQSPPVLVERYGEALLITLNRPNKHNAWSSSMRDALCEALQLGATDDSIQRIYIQGNGPSFSAGGDLNEFGSARDAGIAHLSRSALNAGYLIEQMRQRVTVRVHGACIGAGIEIPAFASRIEADPNAFFELPELRMGLVPGAGGTASILRRIGRQRTAWLGVTGQRIDAIQAKEWGLIDEIVKRDR